MVGCEDGDGSWLAEWINDGGMTGPPQAHSKDGWLLGINPGLPWGGQARPAQCSESGEADWQMGYSRAALMWPELAVDPWQAH